MSTRDRHREKRASNEIHKKILNKIISSFCLQRFGAQILSNLATIIVI